MTPNPRLAAPLNEMCVLSDVLPYEAPPSFSNKGFFLFLVRKLVSIDDGNILWLKECQTLDRIVMLLFGLTNGEHIEEVDKDVNGVKVKFSSCEIARGADTKKGSIQAYTKAFGFKVRSNQSDFRQLSIPHPRSQLAIVEFYNLYKETILYYSSLSDFSIRAPSRIAMQSPLKANRKSGMSILSLNNRNSSKGVAPSKTFFAYQQYDSIYKFYKSDCYHQAESRFKLLIKLDIAKCFDSIYTHLIGWAIYGKETVKESLRFNKKTFANRFDKLMQNMNYGETNGILIGSELSRIFAEIILQAIDRSLSARICLSLPEIRYRKDYEIYRYVDDYFVFVNNDRVGNLIVEELQHSLGEYKLHLNKSKTVTYKHPMLTNISICKHQLAVLVNSAILKGRQPSNQDGDSDEVFTLDSRKLITEYKTVFKNNNVKYREIGTFVFSVVENCLSELFDKYHRARDNNVCYEAIIFSIDNLLDFLFFIYSSSVRVNTTIGLCRVILKILSFLDDFNTHRIHSNGFRQKIHDSLCSTIESNSIAGHVQVETLYLLVALAELGRSFRLPEETLREYLGLYRLGNSRKNDGKPILNYFTITVSLLYMKDFKEYRNLREEIVDEALSTIKSKSASCHAEAETIMLLFDLVACPYIPRGKKLLALGLFGVQKQDEAGDIIDYSYTKGKAQNWFTTWRAFDFARELDFKKGKKVY